MRRFIAAGIAALGLCFPTSSMQDWVFQETRAWGATAAPPVPVRFMLSPGDYTLAIRLFDDESSSQEVEEVEDVIHKGKVVLKLADDPQVSFKGEMPHSTLTFRYGDGTDDVVLRGHLKSDDSLEGQFVVESFGVGTEHGTFTLTKAGKK
jgi:hypothetical protein